MKDSSLRKFNLEVRGPMTHKEMIDRVDFLKEQMLGIPIAPFLKIDR